VQRALGLPECATPPEEACELARRRGMDLVTITDHDTISGALAIADRPDAFVSEELTSWFRGEPQAVHVLCWGITPQDHDWLQQHARATSTRWRSTSTGMRSPARLPTPSMRSPRP
jgi:predicted metal-dependent phosphoesterase TrpH